MIDLPTQRDPVEQLAEQFAHRCREGENPSVGEYTANHPQYAERIQELFPAVAMMEQLRVAETAGREAAAGPTRPETLPERIADFDILREIGRGGMGMVYEAEQRSLGRRVAVKVLPKHALLVQKHLRRFRREAQTAARLHHTNIVPVLGVGEQDGLHYYVMPLIRGVGLDEILRNLRSADGGSAAGSNPLLQLAGASAGPGSGDNGRHRPGHARRGAPASHWRTVARIGIQAAQALDHAHQHGTLHRDIKPGNLLVDRDGVVWVADFGLARAVDDSDASTSGDVVGTLRYMAPEQLRGAGDARSDIYSLGLTLYELLTLRPAFEEADCRRRLRGGQGNLEPVPPRKIAPAIPRDLETIVLKCLAHEPSKRYQTAAAVADDLRRFLDDKPICARRVCSIERAWRWCRRNKALAAVSGLAAVLLVAVAVTAAAAYVQTTTACAETRRELARAEATSELALDVLDGIYLQLSPDRVWIASDSDPGDGACACIGLRSGDPSATALQRSAMQVQASRQTAALLENLLVFYDRLAEQAGDDGQVMLESAIASRRVGDIRQRLGQIDQAERAYGKAVEKLTALRTRTDADPRICTELARSLNEIGNVRSAKLESGPACESHRRALAVLQSFVPAYPSPEPYRYELARTMYFLSNKRPGASDDPNRRGPASMTAAGAVERHETEDCRRSAIRILSELAEANPDAPDYRFLLALCHRPPALAPMPAWGPTGPCGRDRAIRILEELKSQYPGIADYRYELTATYAWFPVGLFPWQGNPDVTPTAEQDLLKALAESQWLVTHNPNIPQYGSSHALILAKLGTVRRNTDRLAEAEDFFRQAVETQNAVVEGFPDLPSHNRVLLEFLRLRLAQIRHERDGDARNLQTAVRTRALLQTCVANLSELVARPELAEDRLALTSLPLACDVLSDVLAETGEDKAARKVKKRGEMVFRRSVPEQRRRRR